MNKKIEIFDSTLRDGAQGEGISYSVRDKLTIAQALDDFGVDYIEAGNPGSNPKDMEFLSQLRGLRHAKVCAFGSTARKGVLPSEDTSVAGLLRAGTQTVTIFGKAWDLHVTEILRVSPEDNLKMIADTVAFLKSQGRELIYDAEHFYDGYKANHGYALETLKAAAAAGADAICLCDTNGACFPDEIYEITSQVTKLFPRVGIHCHNDTGCAVANSISAVKAGAVQVQGTFIGIGERCGNADLSVIIPNLQLKLGYECIEGGLEALRTTAIKITETANVALDPYKPYTGSGAFAHKGGMHSDGVSKISRSFEHVQPESVGNSRRFLLSEVAGRSALLTKLTDIAPQIDKSSPELAGIMSALKDYEHQGYQFEGCDASFKLFVMKQLGMYKPFFELLLYKTIGEYPAPGENIPASALVQIKVGDAAEFGAATGNGPVHALDLALRKSLRVFYPKLNSVRLSDYKVRVLGSGHATASKVRVLIESTDGENVWTTSGVSEDIIEASWIALVDSLEYALCSE